MDNALRFGVKAPGSTLADPTLFSLGKGNLPLFSHPTQVYKGYLAIDRERLFYRLISASTCKMAALHCMLPGKLRNAPTFSLCESVFVCVSVYVHVCQTAEKAGKFKERTGLPG